MPDITLRMLGDAGSAVHAFGEIGAAVAETAGKIVEFSAESIKKFSEAERNLRQLASAAGSYTNMLSEQAEVMKRKYAVDDDAIRHMETLLVRYGAAPGQVQATTEAILNYAAATGKDATGAMEMLIRGVEQGHGSLGRMGVHFQTTGSFAKDLANATDALGKKFAGAGEADAGSLDGRTRRVGLAMDDFKKAIGSMFNEVDQRYGILDKLAKGIDGVTSSLTRNEQETERIAAAKGAFTFTGEGEAAAGAALVSTAAGAASMKAGQGASLGSNNPDRPLGGDHEVGKSGSGADKYKNDLQLYADYNHKMLLEAMHHGEEMEKERVKQLDNQIREQTRILKEDHDAVEKNEKEFEAAKEKDLEIIKRFDDEREKERQRDLEREEREMQQKVSMWFRVGEQIAMTVVQGVMSYMTAVDQQQRDAAGFNLFKSISSVVMSVLGTVTGQSWIGPAWQGMLGGGQAIFEGATGSSMHTGGWIPRFHGGGGFPLGSDERLSILQTGERVLSRGEVSRMGGMAGVDSAARGGGGRQPIQIYAFDSQSIVDFFGNRGSKGMVDAIRLNSGPLRGMFGVG